MKYIKSVLTLSFCGISHFICAQEQKVLTFDGYLKRVSASNVDYLAEKYHVDIADAHTEAANVFPDPELSVSYANNQNWALQMGYGVDAELSYTLELGNKRKARIRLAQSEKEMTAALLEDYFRNLRADATLAYLTALKQKRLYELQKASCRQMLSLAHADSIRFHLGAITEVDARQSRLEAATLLNELHAAESELQESLIRLSLFQGDREMNIPDSIAGRLTTQQRAFDLPALIAMAQHNRADLLAALKYDEISQHNLRLAKANRAIDLGINLGGGYSSIVRNEIAPAPKYWGVTAGVSIPLRFSNANKGALRAARLSAAQSEKQYEAVALQIRSEITQAYHKYTAACRRAAHFDTGLLHEAEAIFQKKVYSYERGETSLFEALNARRAYNDMQASYTETLYECAAALVELERACGIWDIEIKE